MEEYLENMKSLRSYMNGACFSRPQIKSPIPFRISGLIVPSPRGGGCVMGCRSGGGRGEAVRGGAAAAHGHRRPRRRHRTSEGAGEAGERGGRAAGQGEGAGLRGDGREAGQDLHAGGRVRHAEAGEPWSSSIRKLQAHLRNSMKKRLFYTKTTENMTVKLQEQQEWLGSFKIKMIIREPHVAASQSNQNLIEGERHGMYNSEGSLDKLDSDVGNKQGDLNTQLESAELKIQDIKSKRLALLSEISEIKQILEQEKNIIAGFPPALQQMDMKSLEEEYKALQGDKAQEAEYLQSLEETINEVKSVSAPVKCRCELEYKVELGGEAMDMS
ncbi:uncharacterized protein LOC133895788 isoform X2 [Phragmites australis]|uniref:uncharacterized protein LOC133895788 isoform X2 n=1 Tax=Phragmites australis TaxID=29695 RepID=UPI002D76F587|nr:uncharacterized protein LOC133895788 isoform X2 [Phragmites australis]